MKHKKKLIRCLLGTLLGVNTLLASVVSIPASAATKSVYIDNDDSYGHYTTKYGFNNYITSSSYYRNDARTQSAGNTSYYYYYGLSNDLITTSSSANVTLFVHLNDYSFTDTKANYTAICTYEDDLGVYDQNSAPSGWSIAKTFTVAPITSIGEHSTSLFAIRLNSGYISSATTAADGIRIYATY